MPQVKQSFICFRCHYFNNVFVPHYFKGKKCKKCFSFNYFNYIPKYKKKNIHKKNNENYQINFFPSMNDNCFNDDSFSYNNNFNYEDDNISGNSSYNKNNNNINNNNFISTFNYFDNNRTNNLVNSNYNSNHNNFYENDFINILNNRNSGNNINNNSVNNFNYLKNNNENIYFDNVVTNNINHNNFNNYDYFYDNDNFVSFDNLKRENENIIITWLKKQRTTEEMKKKYKDEKCTICLEEISGDISITKCHHVFHYICIAKYINNYGRTECPICRCDLKTGKKMEIVERYISRNNNIFDEIFNFNNNSSNRREQNDRINQNNNEYNRYRNINIDQQREDDFGNIILFLITILIAYFILKKYFNVDIYSFI